MLDALEEAVRDRWTRDNELMRTLILAVDMARCDQIVLHGGERPDAMEIARPGEAPPRPAWAKQMAKLTGGGC